MRKANIRAVVVRTALISGAAALGVTAGALLASAGQGSAPDTWSIGDSKSAESEYPLNKAGQTYGSSLNATSPADEPDLILVYTTDGELGYAKKVDLDHASGADIQSPEEAVAWQKAKDKLARSGVNADETVPVYKEDGTTLIGEFTLPAGDELVIESGE